MYKNPSKNSLEAEKSHFPENRTSIQNHYKEGHQNDEEQKRKKSCLQLYRESNPFDKELQIENGARFEPDSLPTTYTSINTNSNNHSLVHDIGNNETTVGETASLAFRPWGSEKAREVDQRVPFEYASARSNPEVRSFKGNVIYCKPV